MTDFLSVDQAAPEPEPVDHTALTQAAEALLRLTWLVLLLTSPAIVWLTWRAVL